MKKDNLKKPKQDNKQTGTSDYQQDTHKLEPEADKERSRKPGSQSNSGNQHNSGRGGGK